MKNLVDYFLGGCLLGLWFVVFFVGVFDMSGWLLFGLLGYVYVAGIELFWLVGGLFVGIWVNWLVNVKCLCIYSIIMDFLILFEFLLCCFNDNLKFI